MKLSEITIVLMAIAGILLASCDSESWAWFLWSKVIAACLLGLSIMLCNIIKQREEANRYED